MKKYKAIFFDRDGTMTYNDPKYTKMLEDNYLKLTGKKFDLPYERFMKLFNQVSKTDRPYIPYKTIEDEILFFTDLFILLLADDGVKDDLEMKALLLSEKLWYVYKKPFEDTVEVLEYFKSKGYIMGVISDCPPSLKHSLELIGLEKYFTSFTTSSLVGVGKPNPRIFQHALDLERVKAEECLYVDDTLIEADGAREMGFTSFHIDRKGAEVKTEWTISNLRELITFVEENNN